jgi:hypothetical protein
VTIEGESCRLTRCEYPQAGHRGDALTRLLDELTGEATLSHLEEQFGATVKLRAGVGELDVFVREPFGAELRVSEVPTDQTHLAETLRGLNAAVAAFGVRGDAYG